MTHRKGCSLCRAEGFSCSFDVLYGGPRAILDQKNIIFFFSCKFFPFLVIIPWLRIGSGSGSVLSYKMLSPNRTQMNPDSKHCSQYWLEEMWIVDITLLQRRRVSMLWSIRPRAISRKCPATPTSYTSRGNIPTKSLSAWFHHRYPTYSMDTDPVHSP